MASQKSKLREQAQRDILEGLREQSAEFSDEVIQQVTSAIEDAVYDYFNQNEQTKEYRQKMIFLKMRIKGTRNALTRRALLLGKLDLAQLVTMTSPDFTDSFLAEKLAGTDSTASNTNQSQAPQSQSFTPKPFAPGPPPRTAIPEKPAGTFKAPTVATTIPTSTTQNTNLNEQQQTQTQTFDPKLLPTGPPPQVVNSKPATQIPTFVPQQQQQQNQQQYAQFQAEDVHSQQQQQQIPQQEKNTFQFTYENIQPPNVPIAFQAANYVDQTEERLQYTPFQFQQQQQEQQPQSESNEVSDQPPSANPFSSNPFARSSAPAQTAPQQNRLAGRSRYVNPNQLAAQQQSQQQQQPNAMVLPPSDLPVDLPPTQVVPPPQVNTNNSLQTQNTQPSEYIQQQAVQNQQREEEPYSKPTAEVQQEQRPAVTIPTQQVFNRQPVVTPPMPVRKAPPANPNPRSEISTSNPSVQSQQLPPTPVEITKPVVEPIKPQVVELPSKPITVGSSQIASGNRMELDSQSQSAQLMYASQVSGFESKLSQESVEKIISQFSLELKEENHQSSIRIAELEKQQAETNAFISNLNISVLSNQIKDLESKFSDQASALTNARQQLESAELQITQLTQIIEQFVRNQSPPVLPHPDIVAKQDNIASAYEQKITQLQKDLRTQELAQQLQKKENERLQNQVSSQQSQLDSLNNTVTQLTQNLEKSEKSNILLQAANNTLSSENSSLHSQVEELKKQLANASSAQAFVPSAGANTQQTESGQANSFLQLHNKQQSATSSTEQRQTPQTSRTPSMQFQQAPLPATKQQQQQQVQQSPIQQQSQIPTNNSLQQNTLYPPMTQLTSKVSNTPADAEDFFDSINGGNQSLNSSKLLNVSSSPVPPNPTLNPVANTIPTKTFAPPPPQNNQPAKSRRVQRGAENMFD